MVTELVFVKMFLDRNNYLSYRSYIKSGDMEPQTNTLLNQIDRWYQTNTEGGPTTQDLYFLCLPEMEKNEVSRIVRTIEGIEVPATAIMALSAFRQQREYEQISIAAFEASQGNIDSANKLADLISKQSDKQVNSELDDLFEDWSLSRINDETDRSQGLEWRLGCFKQHLGNLIPGDFGFFVARPETGKTSMLASEITHMAEGLRPNQGPIIWFNNEEANPKVQARIYCAAYNITSSEVSADPQGWEEKFNSDYGDKIKLFKEQTITRENVESTVALAKPSLIILDQIDPIIGWKADREDLRLGQIYKWARQLGIRFKCAVLGVSQANNDAEGVEYLYMNHVANAKTEKQATADFIVGIGKNHQDAYQNLRFLHFMKNKLTGKHTKHEVIIDAERARYRDI